MKFQDGNLVAIEGATIGTDFELFECEKFKFLVVTLLCMYDPRLSDSTTNFST